MIELSLDGRALDATEGCLSAVGYSWVDRRSKHHRIFSPCAGATRPRPCQLLDEAGRWRGRHALLWTPNTAPGSTLSPQAET